MPEPAVNLILEFFSNGKGIDPSGRELLCFK
jgi:hypothetical protein